MLNGIEVPNMSFLIKNTLIYCWNMGLQYELHYVCMRRFCLLEVYLCLQCFSPKITLEEDLNGCAASVSFHSSKVIFCLFDFALFSSFLPPWPFPPSRCKRYHQHPQAWWTSYHDLCVLFLPCFCWSWAGIVVEPITLPISIFRWLSYPYTYAFWEQVDKSNIVILINKWIARIMLLENLNQSIGMAHCVTLLV